MEGEGKQRQFAGVDLHTMPLEAGLIVKHTHRVDRDAGTGAVGTASRKDRPTGRDRAREKARAHTRTQIFACTVSAGQRPPPRQTIVARDLACDVFVARSLACDAPWADQARPARIVHARPRAQKGVHTGLRGQCSGPPTCVRRLLATF